MRQTLTAPPSNADSIPKAMVTVSISNTPATPMLSMNTWWARVNVVSTNWIMWPAFFNTDGPSFSHINAKALKITNVFIFPFSRKFGFRIISWTCCNRYRKKFPGISSFRRFWSTSTRHNARVSQLPFSFPSISWSGSSSAVDGSTFSKITPPVSPYPKRQCLAIKATRTSERSPAALEFSAKTSDCKNEFLHSESGSSLQTNTWSAVNAVTWLVRFKNVDSSSSRAVLLKAKSMNKFSEFARKIFGCVWRHISEWREGAEGRRVNSK